MSASTDLMLSPLANRAVARLDGEDVVFTTLPRWVESALGIDDRSGGRVNPSRTPRHPLAGVAGAAVYVIRSGRRLEGYFLELPAREGEAPVAVLLAGERGTDHDGGPAAMLFFQDVSAVVRERRQAAAVGAYHGMVGQSLPMLEVYHRIALYGPVDAPVVVTGETGSGKELVAKALHERSKRADGPFVPVNCTALTPELFESELFGHEKGSFTGAHRQHRGRFERADGGTLFLDEIGDMPLMTQAKLLRALEEGVIERVGSESEQEVDVRVVAATNVALEYAVASGRFRADLYHRLNVFRIHLPPLRDRTGDIPLLVERYLEELNARYDKSVRRLTPEALRMLEDYDWPGNVRELRNVLERLVVETGTEAIGANAMSRWVSERDFFLPGAWNVESAVGRRNPIPAPARFDPFEVGPPPRHGGQFWGGEQRGGRGDAPRIPAGAGHEAVTLGPDDVVIETGARVAGGRAADPPTELTEDSIREAFVAERGNATGAARRLGVHKATLYRHMKRLGLTREELERDLTPRDGGQG